LEEFHKEIVKDKKAIVELLAKNGVEVEESLSPWQTLGRLFDVFVEDKLIDPTYIIDYPIEISPLARKK